MTASELVDFLEYGQSKEYLSCLKSYEEFIGWIDYDGSKKKKYIEIITEQGARTPMSRQILTHIAKEQNCDIVEYGALMYLDKGISQANIDTPCTEGETDMARKQLKERVEIGKDNDNKPIYKWATGYTRQELIQNAAALLQENQAPAPAVKTITFGEYAMKWRELYKVGKVRHNTLTGYDGYLNNYILPFFGKHDMRDIGIDDVQRFLNSIAYNAKGEQRAKKTIDEAKRTLAMVLEAAKESELIRTNPAKSKALKNPSKVKHERLALTTAQAKDIEAHLPDIKELRDRRLLAMLLYLPVRMEDVVGFQIKDICVDTMEIHARQSVTYDKHAQAVIDEPKTEAGKRSMLILPELWRALELSETELADGERYILHHNTDDHQPYSFQMKRRAWERIVQQVNVYGKTPHCFRHTFATRAYRAGVPEKTIQTMGGWKDLSTMRGIYIHTQQEDMDNARQLLASM